MADTQPRPVDAHEAETTTASEDQATAAYAAPAILALGDVNTDTLQTGIP